MKLPNFKKKSISIFLLNYIILGYCPSITILKNGNQVYLNLQSAIFKPCRLLSLLRHQDTNDSSRFPFVLKYINYYPNYMSQYICTLCTPHRNLARNHLTFFLISEIKFLGKIKVFLDLVILSFCKEKCHNLEARVKYGVEK